MKRKKKKKNLPDEFRAWKSVRKPMPKPSRAINPKKKYDRRDKSWMEEN